MRSAETEAAAPLISCSFPLPIRVAGSGLSRCCRNSPAISAPALPASARNSSSDSWALNSGARRGHGRNDFRLMRRGRSGCWFPLVRKRVRRPAHHHSRDGMLEDQLLLVVGVQNDRVFVEGADPARQLYPAEQVNGDGVLLL